MVRRAKRDGGRKWQEEETEKEWQEEEREKRGMKISAGIGRQHGCDIVGDIAHVFPIDWTRGHLSRGRMSSKLFLIGDIDDEIWAAGGKRERGERGGSTMEGICVEALPDQPGALGPFGGEVLDLIGRIRSIVRLRL